MYGHQDDKLKSQSQIFLKAHLLNKLYSYTVFYFLFLFKSNSSIGIEKVKSCFITVSKLWQQQQRGGGHCS